MILFNHNKIEQQQLDPDKHYLLYLKIFGAIAIKIVLLCFNIFTVNYQLLNFWYLYAIIIGFIVIEAGVGLGYKFGGGECLGLVERKGKYQGKVGDELQQSQARVNVYKHPSPTLASSSCAQHSPTSPKLITALWHLIAFINTTILILSIGSVLQTVLSARIYKIRSPLYPIIFHTLLSVSYFATIPHPHLKYQKPSFSQLKPSHAHDFHSQFSSLNYAHLHPLYKYKCTEIQCLKYISFSYALGAILDYISYGYSDTVNFNINFNINLGNGANITLNQVCFYAVMGLTVIGGGFFLCKRSNFIGMVKQIVQSQ